MTEPLDIRDDRANGRLEAYEGGRYAGGISYFVLDGAPHALVAVHTVVDPGHRGKGIGGHLVRAFYAMARNADVPVVPLCPYAAQWAERHRAHAPAAPAHLAAEAERQLRTRPSAARGA
ncbi:GNAT family N-acetyltransferase [Streptomyces sp. TRM49041]|uniref:GNAT family N-acetyltransferase n=1 Tax=Streptomyces sp. TRM49041 TaxID=2603216 RepID=UPI0011ED61B9|nr:GNAT family N-acetyltransferase [Streptomyces sp. TRM49041]